MIQHILIADVGALLVVAGLTGPILRPILALPYVGERCPSRLPAHELLRHGRDDVAALLEPLPGPAWFGAAWLFLRWMKEGERAETLINEGVNPRAAARAARYGR